MTSTLSAEQIGILARKGRIEVIRTLKAYPEKDFTINELARKANVATMTTWRAVKDLKRAGWVKTRKIGNGTSVTMSEDKETLRTLRLVPDTDPQRNAAKMFASALGQYSWASEFRLFGNIGRGEHAPGEEVDVAVVYNESEISEEQAKAVAAQLAEQTMLNTNVMIMPLCIAQKEMARRGGLAAELRDKEIIWRR